MIRFTMPEPALPMREQITELKEQFDSFLRSEALSELFEVLKTDRDSFKNTYDTRRMPDGKVRETQELKSVESLEDVRKPLYPLLLELGFFTINKPLHPEHSRVIVPGGSLDTCFCRTKCAAGWVDSSTRFVDGLACYRPIHPRERMTSSFSSTGDTEFGVLSDSFQREFRLSFTPEEEVFCGDRNLNGISCIRTLHGEEKNRRFRIFAAPSSEPSLRRADTGDTMRFYLQHDKPEKTDSMLVITDNQYCNRQFVQFAYELMKNERPLSLDVIGCTPDERVVTCERYDPVHFLQGLIALLDWIERFNQI